MVRMPPVHDANGSRAGQQGRPVINETTSQMQRLSVLSLSARALVLTGADRCDGAAGGADLDLIYVGFRFEWRLAAGVVIAPRTTW